MTEGGAEVSPITEGQLGGPESGSRWAFLRKVKSMFSREERKEIGPSVKRTYKIGNDEVDLLGQVLLPKDGKVADESEVALFLVGAPMRAKASVTWDTPKGLAESSKVRAYTLDARPKGRFEQNSVALEVEAIRRFLEELNKQGVSKITIFGHSIGARKGIDLVAALEQQNPNLQINGLVLSNPMGFYEQEPGMVGRWMKEADNEGKIKNPRVHHEPVPKIMAQLAGSTAADIRQTGFGYKKWVEEQFEALNTIDPNLSEVKAPTLLLLGTKDLLAVADKVLPEEEINKRMPQTSAEGQLMRSIIKEGIKWDQLNPEQQAKFGNKETFIRLQREQIAQRGRAHNQYIKERMPNVKNLQVIVATKFATHVGFGVERGDQTSHVVSKVFNRLRRPNTKAA